MYPTNNSSEHKSINISAVAITSLQRRHYFRVEIDCAFVYIKIQILLKWIDFMNLLFCSCLTTSAMHFIINLTTRATYVFSRKR